MHVANIAESKVRQINKEGIGIDDTNKQDRL